MYASQDVQKLIKEFSTVFSTRQEIDSQFDALHKDFSDFHQIADKVGVQLEYL